MIVERIYKWAQLTPNKTAVIWNNSQLSYVNFSNAIQSTRAFLQRENLPAGRTAVVLSNNRLDSWIIVMALRTLGLHTISILRPEGVKLLNLRDVACIAVTQVEAAIGWANIDAISGHKVVVIPKQIYDLEEKNELLGIQPGVHPLGGHILFTSGTTGTYKKLLLRGEYEDLRNAARMQSYNFDANTIYHGASYGLWTGNGFKTPSAIWHAGGCVVLDQSKEIFKNFFRHGVTFSKLGPAVLKDLLKERSPLARPVDTFSLSVGGGFLPIGLAEKTIQTLTANLIVNFSSTEITSVRLWSRFRTKDDLLWLMPTDERRVQIADENGTECPANQEGRLRIVLSEIDCHQYVDDETASARAFQNVFFYPGDLAVRRKDGRIRILGRADDVVVLSGRKLAVAPIEQAIAYSLQVDEACVFSGLTERGDEAFVVALEADRSIPQPQLDALALELADEFVIGEEIRFIICREFPRTETGTEKVNRAMLKKLVFGKLDQTLSGQASD